MLRTHYRQPIDWTVKALEEAEQTLDNGIRSRLCRCRTRSPLRRCDAKRSPTISTRRKRSPLSTNLRAEASGGAIGAARCLKASARMLGLLAAYGRRLGRLARSSDDRRSKLSSKSSSPIAPPPVPPRTGPKADRIRDELAAMGIVLKDNKDGTTTWEVKR